VDIALTIPHDVSVARAMAPGAPRGYEQALDYLFARTTGAFKFGLERTIALLDALGNPQRAFAGLHIAGTNGKGSSVATAEALLRGKGLRVGAYTSPHLVDFRERIVVDGAYIPADEVVEFVERWTPIVESLGATFFEATTALAFMHFARRGVDVALIETGLGGRLDSTNVISPLAAGVTTINYDHMEYLGDTLEKIAAEKAGIYKRGRPAIVGERDPSIRSILAEHAREAGARPIRIVSEECTISDVQVDASGTSFVIEALGDRRQLRSVLAGQHQAQNVAFALTLLDAAGPPYATTLEAAEVALPTIRIPGRFQLCGRYVFDVAHNPEGAEVLARTLLEVAPEPPVVALFSVLADKDWRQMLRTLARSVSCFIITTAPSAPRNRVWELPEVARFAADESIPVEVIADFEAALARASSLGATTLVTGSFHTVGDAMARLQLSPLSR
jgi:dihydrofolate synthase / folylpolyglutamate synthase